MYSEYVYRVLCALAIFSGCGGHVDPSLPRSSPTAGLKNTTAPAGCPSVDAGGAASHDRSAPELDADGDDEAPPGRDAAAPTDEVLSSTGDDRLRLSPVTFADLPGWADDRHAEATRALAASCTQLAALADRQWVGATPYAGQARHWRRACAAARALVADDHNRAEGASDREARLFFEKYFTPYAAAGKLGPVGKVTAYYVQPLRGSRARTGKYLFPLFARPPDLVSARLDEFVPDGRSRRVWGRVDERTGQLVPYPERAPFRRAATDPAAVLVWVDDPLDALSVEIEGSGRVELSDGTTMWVGFAGKNGHASTTSLGAVWRELFALRQARGAGPWSPDLLARYEEIMDAKKSLVFFAAQDQPGALGTQGVVLTPKRSIAVDRATIALSTPVWVETTVDAAPWRRLLVAQDTGGHILGTVRADIYWGDDADAVATGRHLNAPGKMWLLLPRGVRTSVALTKPNERILR